ncbi:ArsR/SmtB family transcription factor [Halovenus rubra]|uniref:ArsR/SmtB family transcription factor n=2 Tax=Halovenus rubra TaxID=869890 RepID=A0ABD5X7E1_9EURY|nr:metalloregulator ArsR/SmtB family transcription factor [Halovenus rubra]
MGQSEDRLRRLLEDELEECCEADVEHRMGELEQVADRADRVVHTDTAVLGVLSNETRLLLVRALDTAGRELCVCELEALADVSESAVSHALSDLANVGLVTREKRGKWRYYNATERATAILSTLDETRPRGENA